MSDNLPNQPPKKQKPKLAVVLASCVLLALLLGFGAHYAYKLYQRYQEEKLAKLASEIYNQPTPTPAPTPEPTPEPTAEPTPEPTATPEPEPTPRVISLEFAALRAQFGNDDIIGYLRIEGTSIDYPVVHTTDNSFYLDHDIEKKPSMPGWIFMDYDNDVEKEDYNTIIYGHNMKADTMFHALRYYRDEAFYKEHKYVTFDTIYEKQTWEVFSFHIANIKFNYIQVFFKDQDSFFELLSELKNRSMYDTGVEVTKEDRVLTLSTCSNQNPDTRFVLNAKLVRPQAEVETTSETPETTPEASN